jgi:arylsulfatase A-like enzyme
MTRRNSLLLLVVLIGVGVAAGVWWWRRPPSRRNVILITVDTLRPDRLSAYGYTKHHTPNFDRLAQEGVLFENAFCDVTWTTPSMASVMTGRYATVHGMRSSYQQLSPDVTTLAEVLHAHGRQTAAIVGSFPLDSMFGLDQGFELYDDTFRLPLVLSHDGDPTPEAPAKSTPGAKGILRQMRQFLLEKATHDAYRPDNEVSDRAIRWLREERREPFFLWVHYFGPHEKPQQQASSDEEQRQIQLAQYDPDVAFADEQVGRLLAVLDESGLTDHTAVILHADHGQSLGEHFYFGHGRRVYDPSQHIPLIMRLPGVIPIGRRVTRMVRNIDILPTVLDLTHVQASIPLDGVSLLPIMAGADLGGPEEVYVETYLPTLSLFADLVGEHKVHMGFRRLGIRTPEWKFIINDPREFMDVDHPPPVTDEMRKRYYFEQLFDLRADPGEQHDVINQHRDLAKRFFNRVMEYQKMHGLKSPSMSLKEGDRERLRSLGYMVE